MVKRNITRALALGGVIAASVSCGDVARTGRGPVYLVIDILQGQAGGREAGEFGGTLFSDVETLITEPEPCSPERPCRTVFSDSGQVQLRLAPKDIGTVGPTTNNEVTIRRYRVTYRRADGRNTPGVDVPYGFDGAFTGTVPSSGNATFTFEIVRHAAKKESPLIQLVTSPSVMATIAEVTFYGEDRVGNDVTASGSILIEFGNFGD